MAIGAGPMANLEDDDSLADDKIFQAKGGIHGFVSILLLGRNHKWPLTRSILVIFMSSACALASARFIGSAVEILAGKSVETSVTKPTLYFIFLEILTLVLVYFGRVSLAQTTNEIIYVTRKNLVEKLGRLPMSYFDAQPIGRTITRLTADVEGIETLFRATLAKVLSAVVTIISVFVAMITLQPKFGLFIVASALPSLLLNYFARKVLFYWLRTQKKRNAKANAMLAELLIGLQVIKLLHLEAWSRSIYDRMVNSHLRASVNLMHWNTLIRPLTVMLCLVPTVLVIVFGGGQVIDGTMTLGMFVIFVRYSERFLNPVRVISQEVNQIQDALSSSERIAQLLVEPDESVELGVDGNHVGKIKGSVEYENISMSYGGSKTVLKNISFKVEPGMRVGLVGESGSGKSSTVNLLPRLYPYQAGRILLDNIPLDQWERKNLRQQLGVVSQDVVIFKGTLRENLLGAAQLPEEISDAMILDSAEKTGLKRVMRNFPIGLNTFIHQGGSNLSMGERQLIAFTRMLIKDPAILILDEATANIDEAHEILIQNATSVVMENRTCFIVAHRLSTIVQCDLILVFRDGVIVEMGSHSELAKQGGYYAELIRRQI
jgi:ABC-type multidrug transport system fused ATPase/permease subunit